MVAPFEIRRSLSLYSHAQAERAPAAKPRGHTRA